ncbi:MAG TPA: zinc-binding dehydrogenase [Gemmataceae bacterium]|nr:zinc-binding dehydrogenase [Gemmataceae bacterium]
MKTPAAILVETGKPLVVDDLDIPPLRPGQALVEIHFSGVCHTQLLEVKGHRGKDPYLPHCLGHEGSGVVREVGPGVAKVKPDDPVILSWIKGGGANVPGTTYRWGGRTVNAGAITTFSRFAVISENRLTVLPAGLPMEDAALLGCAVPTGVGAVCNTAKAGPGQSVAVFGAGGVGLSAVAGAAVAGCTPIIAVDLVASRLDLARGMGATHAVNPSDGDAVEAIGRLCPGGVDIAIEATGRPAVMRQALAAVRPQGGVAVVVGNARDGEALEIDPKQLNQGKQLRGTWGGDNQPDTDFPRYGRLLASGRLNVGPIRSAPFRLEQINEALEALEGGAVGRPLVGMRAA